MSDEREPDETHSSIEFAPAATLHVAELLGLNDPTRARPTRPTGLSPSHAGRYLQKAARSGEMDFTGQAEWGSEGTFLNGVNGDHSVVAGGSINAATDDHATVSGGNLNVASDEFAAIGGGQTNLASDRFATVGGGSSNDAEGVFSAVGGGHDNEVVGDYATVSGGREQWVTGDYATVGGGEDHRATGDYATVGGGGPYSEADRFDGNRATARGSTVSGGLSNEAGGDWSTVGGGTFNAVPGGRADERGAMAAVVSGGAVNEATGDYAAVGGGNSNAASGRFSTVSGGKDNTSEASTATVPGGLKNRARGESSFAAGERARARHDNTFVWNDGVTDSDEPETFESTEEGQFLVHADGGVGIGTEDPRSPLHVRTMASTPLGAPTVEHHVACFENVNNERHTLAVKTGQAIGEMTSNTNFVTFFSVNDTPVGSIEGDGGSGVKLKSGGADYAERLPLRDDDASVEPGDVVGVHGGEVSRETAGADRAMVVSEAPVVLGSAPPATDASASAPVAFVGQVSTKVRGPVEAGDLVAASGDGDGTAVAVDTDGRHLADRDGLVGQAWETDESAGVSTVTVAVGLADAGALATHLDRQRRRLEERASAIETRERRIEDLEAENEALRSRLDALQERVAEVESTLSRAATTGD